VDFQFAGRDFIRYYHSLGELDSGHLSKGWSHSYSDRVIPVTAGVPIVVSKEGYYEGLISIGGVRYAVANSPNDFFEKLPSGGYRLTRADGEIREFDSSGKLTLVEFRGDAAEL